MGNWGIKSNWKFLSLYKFLPLQVPRLWGEEDIAWKVTMCICGKISILNQISCCIWFLRKTVPEQ